jgi:hypothetical protein
VDLVLPFCSQSKVQQANSRLPATLVTGYLPAKIYGGRYWDRTSDLFGVNQDAACPSSSGNATTRRKAGAVQSDLMHQSAVQCRSEQRCAPPLLPKCIQAPGEASLASTVHTLLDRACVHVGSRGIGLGCHPDSAGPAYRSIERVTTPSSERINFRSAGGRLDLQVPLNSRADAG